MKLVLKIIGMIPAKRLAKYIPEVLAFIFTRVLKWLSVHRPEKLRIFMQLSQKVVKVLQLALDAGSDGVIDQKEIKAIGEALRKEIK